MLRFLLLLISSHLIADITDHLKKITDKTGYHQIKNVDFIYMINLDQRPEKYAICMDRLAPYGIVPYRFSAVNGWELTLEAINDLGVKYEPWMSTGMGTRYLMNGNSEPFHGPLTEFGETYFSHCMSRGAIGICLSHLSILQDAWDSGYETIWVMEDDIAPIQNPHLISTRIKELDTLLGKDGWDILFTDQDTKNNNGQYVPCTGFAWQPNFSPANTSRFTQRYDVGTEFRKVGARFGAYSMIVRRSGMEKILKFFKSFNIFLPYDIEFALPNGIRFYALINDIVSTQPGSLSDNGSPDYKNKEK